MIPASGNSLAEFATAACLVIAAGLVTGCGSSSPADEVSGVNVRGRLLENGKPLVLLPEERIRVGFVNVNGDVSSTAEYDPETGSFEITGPNGKGVPPGEYRVEIVSEIYGGDGENRFGEVYDAEVTPLTATVGGEEGQAFVIDVRKRTITKP